MRKIKKMSTAVVLALFMSVLSAVASSSSPSLSIRITEKEIIENHDVRELRFKVEVTGLPSSRALHIIPLCETSSGRVKLPVLLLNGKSRNRFRRRERSLSTHEEFKSSNICSEETIPSSDLPYETRYTSSLPCGATGPFRVYVEIYEETCCELRLLEVETGDPKTSSLLESPSVSDSSSDPGPVPSNNADTVSLSDRFFRRSFSRLTEGMVTFERPVSEQEKIRHETLSLYLNYKVDRSEILRDFGDNSRELSRLDSAFLRVPSPDREIKKVVITGYASIEAPYDYNLSLSERRSKAVREYILGKYSFLRDTAVHFLGKGEDWEGLTKLVSGGTMPHKEEVLEIISKVGIHEGREKRLFDLRGGIPYKYMQSEYFPSLRRSEVTVEYKVRAYDFDELEGVYKSCPKDLSALEMYELARSRSRSRRDSDYGREYLESARLNSKDLPSLINAFSVSLLRGDLLSSRHYAELLQSEPRAYNNLGVYHLILGEEEPATSYFMKAISSGYSEKEARSNLENMSRIENTVSNK